MRTLLGAGILCAMAAVGHGALIGKVTVTAEQAPIMQGKEVIGTARKGDVLTVTSINGDWYGVAPSRGWIHAGNVQYQPDAARPAGGARGAAPEGTAQPLPADEPARPAPPKTAGPPQAGAVVTGVDGCRLYETAELEGEGRPTPAGTPLSMVRGTDPDIVRVALADGRTGYVRRCWLCSEQEFQRRKGTRQVPQNTICIGFDDKGSFLYGGSLRIVNNAPALGVGDAFWFDRTMKGRPFTIGTETVTGDPEVLVLYTSGGKVVKLPIAAIATRADPAKAPADPVPQPAEPAPTDASTPEAYLKKLGIVAESRFDWSKCPRAGNILMVKAAGVPDPDDIWRPCRIRYEDPTGRLVGFYIQKVTKVSQSETAAVFRIRYVVPVGGAGPVVSVRDGQPLQPLPPVPNDFAVWRFMCLTLTKQGNTWKWQQATYAPDDLDVSDSQLAPPKSQMLSEEEAERMDHLTRTALRKAGIEP